MGHVIKIRPADESDEEAIRSCAEQAYQRYVAAIGKEPAPMVADFANLIRVGSTFVAEGPDRQTLGFIIFHINVDHILLENVAVAPTAAGQGVGGTLIAYCEAEARRLNLPSVRLYTNEKMTGNLSLYPHLGYRETDRRREDGFNRVYFEKRL